MQMKKILYGGVTLVVAAFLLYNSVYITSLSERREEVKAQVFDPTQAIEVFWEKGVEELQAKALHIQTFDRLLSQNPTELAKKHGNTLGIGAPYSLLIKGKAVITKVENEIAILQFDSKTNYQIRIGSIFSNTVREASGSFDLDQFETTMDFNLVAIEINDRIVKDILTPLDGQLIPGATVEFVGATDIDLRRLPMRIVEIIPIQLQIKQP